MKDVFLQKDILDAYFQDLVERLYYREGVSQGSQEDYPHPEVLCPIGTSGREVCYAMLQFIPPQLHSNLFIVDIRLNRGRNGGISFHNSDSGEILTDEEVQSYFSDKTVLLIDGLVYSGGTLKEAYKAPQEIGPKRIVSYSTVVCFSSLLIPNYFSVLVGKHDRAQLHFGEEVHVIPNKRLDGFGCVRKLLEEDADLDIPVPSVGESQFKTWHDVLSYCRNPKRGCFVYEKDRAIQAYVVYEINKENSSLLVFTLIVGKEYVGNNIPGNLWRWMDTYADANYLEQIRMWVPEGEFDFYERVGFRFPEGRPDRLSGTIMVRNVPYPLPYGHRA